MQARTLLFLAFLCCLTTTQAFAFSEAELPPYVAYQLKVSGRLSGLSGIPVSRAGSSGYFELKKVESVLMPAADTAGGESNALPLLSFLLKEGKGCSDDGDFCKSKRDCSDGAVCAKAPRYAREIFEVTDANGSFSVQTIKPAHLLMPAGVAVDGLPSLPDPDDFPMESYICYKSRATGLPRGLSIQLSDGFSSGTRQLALKRFSNLCLPAEVLDSDIHRPHSGLACYTAKPDRGEPRHQPIEDVVAFAGRAAGYYPILGETKKERRVCLPATIGPEPTPWTVEIGVDGELGDWPPTASFRTARGTNYIGWDRDNIYMAVSHPELVGTAEGLSVVAYLGDGKSGLSQTPVVGSHAAQLPRWMSLAVQYEPANQLFSLLSASPAGGWQPVAAKNSGSAAWNATDGAVEFSIPRSLLPASANIYMHLSVYDTRSGSERNFGASPPGAEITTDPENAYAPEVVAFGPDGDSPPDANGQRFGWDDEAPAGPVWGVFPTPVPDSDSLRVATFNVAHLEIPLDDIDFKVYLETQIKTHCLSLVGIVAALFPPAALLGPAACLTDAPTLAVLGLLEEMNEDFDQKFGWDSNEVRAQEIAQRLLNADLDVIVLNEVFDEDARKAYVQFLKGKFPHRIERIQPEFAPAYLEFLPSISEDWDAGHFGAYRVNDSGLMVFSRFPLLDLGGPGASVDSGTEYVVGDQNGTQTIVGGGPGGKLAFRTFEECRKSDCMAGKGVGLVQVDKGTRPATILFTHQQATYGGDDDEQITQSLEIRRAQMEQIADLMLGVQPDPSRKEIYLAGDLNVIGRHLDGPPPDVDSADSAAGNEHYDSGRQEWMHHFCGLRGEPGEEPLPCDNSGAVDEAFQGQQPPTAFSCGGGTEVTCGAARLVDSWAYDSSPLDPGLTNPASTVSGGYLEKSCCGGQSGLTGDGEDRTCASEVKTDLCYGQRLDYILHNTPLEPRLCAQHMAIAYDLVVATGKFLALASDHLPVVGDFNKWWHHCRPVEAAQVDLAFDSDESNFLPPEPDDIRIQWPGAMQWFEIKHKGAYSISVHGAAPLSVDFEVFRNDDLSRPISSYHGLKSDWGKRYSCDSEPCFVRVFAVDDNGEPDRSATGNYDITIHRHKCISSFDACHVSAGNQLEALWPDYSFTSWDQDDPSPHKCDAANPSCMTDALWFLISAYRDDDNQVPETRFRVENECLLGVEVEGGPEMGMVMEVLERKPQDYAGALLEELPYDRSECANNGPVGCTGTNWEQTSSGCGGRLLGPDLCEMETSETRLEAARPKNQNQAGTQLFVRVLRFAPWIGVQSCSSGLECFAKRECDSCDTGKCTDEGNPGGADVSTRRMTFEYGTDLSILFPSRLDVLNKEDGWPDTKDEVQVRVGRNQAPTGVYTKDTCVNDPNDPEWQFYAQLGEGAASGVAWPGKADLETAFAYSSEISVEFAESKITNCEVYPEYILPQKGKWSSIAPLAHWRSSETLASDPVAGADKRVYQDPPDEVPKDAHYRYEMHYCLMREMPDVESCPDFTNPDHFVSCYNACIGAGG